MSGKKPKKQVLDPNEIREQSTIDWHRNNPNVNNYYGSSTTTFDGDQATVNQQYSEPVQGIIDQRTDFLSQGPRQLDATQNPTLMNMFMQAANNVNRRNGDPNQSKPMGGQEPIPMPKPGMNDAAANKPLEVMPNPAPGVMAQGNSPLFGQSHSPMGGGGNGASGMGGIADFLSEWNASKERRGSISPYYGRG